jgi:orotate phosphoribosyltransferase
MEYRSVADLNHTVARWATRLPRDVELLVGIPRSGLLAANLLALHLNLPVTDVEGLLQGRVMQSGGRYRGLPLEQLLARPANVLVVDDSAWSGATLQGVRARLEAAALPHIVQSGAVFASPEVVGSGELDHVAEILRAPALFEWSLMHTPRMARFCVDIDGVLCRDPLRDSNDDGRRYDKFVRTATPLLLPRHEIGWLVTSRLEKYRDRTEEWLRRNGVHYGELIMMQYPDMKARQAAKAYSRFKADAYLETGAELFIESAAHTALQVARLSGRAVFCADTRELLRPGDESRVPHLPVRPLHPVHRAVRSASRLPRRALNKIKRW